MKHCMLDIETLGTRPGDAILSIGAVLFDPLEQKITSEFYVTINPESSKAAGLKAQKSTIEWWQQQSPEAQAAAFKGELSIESALTQFGMWLPPDITLVYGNGSDFDNVLLAAAYRAISKDVPWKFWNNRCYRTIIAMHLRHKIERTGMYHHALDDARTQANRLMHVVQDAKIELK